jgi:hypothetical protein
MLTGTPRPSDQTWRLVPLFARSVGFGPARSPLWRFHDHRIERAPLPLNASSPIIIAEHADEQFLEHALPLPLLKELESGDDTSGPSQTLAESAGIGSRCAADR